MPYSSVQDVQILTLLLNLTEEKIMNTKDVLGACSMALLITGSGMVSDAMAREVKSPSPNAIRSQTQIGAQTFIVEDLGSGVAADLYRLTCNARSVQADVKDIGNFFDTNFQVCVIGSAGGIEGKASCRISPQGGLSGVASVSRSTATNGDLRAYALYTEVNAAGFEKYDTVQLCRNADGTFENPVIVKILDQ